MDKANRSYNGATTSINSSDKGQVSSTRVRHALATGDIDYVTELLGRKHRLVLSLNEGGSLFTEKRILAPRSCVLNQPPGDGTYENCDFLVNSDLVGSCRVAINAENIDIELNDPSFGQENATKDGDNIGIEFG